MINTLFSHSRSLLNKLNQTDKGSQVTHIHHVEVAVDLCIVLLDLVMDLADGQLLFTPVNLFILE